MTEPALGGEGFLREEMLAQRSRRRLSTPEVKRIAGRKTHLTKEGEGIMGRVGARGRDGEVFHGGGHGMRECAGREGAEIIKEPTRASPDANPQASAID